LEAALAQLVQAEAQAQAAAARAAKLQAAGGITTQPIGVSSGGISGGETKTQLEGKK
jgi:hypothetical protein